MSDTEWTSKSGSDEWLTAERAHEYKMAELAAKQADEDRRERRWQREEWTKRVGFVVTGLTIAAHRPGHRLGRLVEREREHSLAEERKEIACIEQGGTWTSVGSGNARRAATGSEKSMSEWDEYSGKDLAIEAALDSGGAAREIEHLRRYRTAYAKAEERIRARRDFVAVLVSNAEASPAPDRQPVQDKISRHLAEIEGLTERTGVS